jgi:hypothetical protein
VFEFEFDSEQSRAEQIGEFNDHFRRLFVVGSLRIRKYGHGSGSMSMKLPSDSPPFVSRAQAKLQQIYAMKSSRVDRSSESSCEAMMRR